MNIRASGTYLDATFGRGGHAGAILQNLIANGRLLCLDRDSVAVADARVRFASDPRVAVFFAAFSTLANCADQVEPGLKFDGILFDLGVSSPQLDDAARGFSFSQDGPLDMRMDPTRGQPVSVWLAHADVDEIRHVISTLGEERFAKRIAAEIVRARDSQVLTRTGELAALVARCVRTREPG